VQELACRFPNPDGPWAGILTEPILVDADDWQPMPERLQALLMHSMEPALRAIMRSGGV
jgi:hypothetical protein